jgi:hypothetical protein
MARRQTFATVLVSRLYRLSGAESSTFKPQRNSMRPSSFDGFGAPEYSFCVKAWCSRSGVCCIDTSDASSSEMFGDVEAFSVSANMTFEMFLITSGFTAPELDRALSEGGFVGRARSVPSADRLSSEESTSTVCRPRDLLKRKAAPLPARGGARLFHVCDVPVLAALTISTGGGGGGGAWAAEASAATRLGVGRGELSSDEREAWSLATAGMPAIPLVGAAAVEASFNDPRRAA